MKRLGLLALFAHPDDEISIGGTLARYASEGVPITLVIATRGEAATIYCDDCATPETLAQVRTNEMERSCHALGIQDLRWLDWPDGKVNEVERVQAVQKVLEIVREVEPQVVITHPSDGLYPHPDHIALWEIAHEAWQLGAGNGLPAKLYHRAIPESLLNLIPQFRDYRIKLNGQQLAFATTPDEEISVVLDVRSWVAQKQEAWAAHISQHNPQGFFNSLSEEVRLEWERQEHLVLTESRLPIPAYAGGGLEKPGVGVTRREDDLFAGLH